jgi:hypothetical protein
MTSSTKLPSRRQAEVLKNTSIDGERYAVGDTFTEALAPPVGPHTGRFLDGDGRAWETLPGSSAKPAHVPADIDKLAAAGLVRHLPEAFEHAAGGYVAIDHLLLGLHGELQPGSPVPQTWQTPDGQQHNTDYARLVRLGLAKPA